MKAGPIIDERDGETEDEAKERHLRELANARAAIAHVDRVLENGRLAARANGYREAARRLRGVVAASVAEVRSLRAALERAKWDFADIGSDAAVAARNRAERALCPPVAARDAALAEVASLREENARLASGGRGGASGVVHREFHKQIVEKLQSERDAALASSRAWCEKAAELQAELDCAVARAKDLEAAMRQVIADAAMADPERALGLIRARVEGALHTPPPASASDRTGTEHHDAADPEDGCQAGARRP